MDTLLPSPTGPFCGPIFLEGVFAGYEVDEIVRRTVRTQKRAEKHAAYARNGLNGPGAVARRKRQRLMRHGHQLGGFHVAQIGGE